MTILRKSKMVRIVSLITDVVVANLLIAKRGKVHASKQIFLKKVLKAGSK